jgi:diphthamide biosynthesis protein 2
MNLSSLYELDRIEQAILSESYKRICFQFSEKYQSDGVWLIQTLAKRLQATGYQEASLYILGDTSYGSCCIDFVGASHVHSDFIVHIGHACLARIGGITIPVMYVFCEEPLYRPDWEDAIVVYFSNAIKHESCSYFLLFLQVNFCRYGEAVQKRLRAAFPHKTIALSVIEKERLPGRLSEWDNFSGWNEESEKQDLKLVYIQERPAVIPLGTDLKDYGFLYIGGEGRTLTNLVINYYKQTIYSFDPSTSSGRREGLSVNRDVMRRTLLINRCMEAEIFGILIGTLGVQSYLQVIQRVTALIKAAGKKYYLISVGKLNPAKLANFLEIDAFILIACHENSLMQRDVDKEFLKPIITPFELMAALNTDDDSFVLHNWTSDFHQFLSLSEAPSEARTTQDFVAQNKEHQDSMKSDRNKPLLLAYEAAQSAFDRFEQRSFKGLNRQLDASEDDGNTASAGIHIGKIGTPRSYQDAKS